jgi:DNA-binding NarL/FixJ family response regulator
MRILVVDDNYRVRRGVMGLLSSEKGWEVCGEATDGAEALQMARELHPDLVIVDICMPGIGGLEAARLLSKEIPSTKILIMSQHDPIQVLPGALEAGAHACVDKSRLGCDLLPAIKAVSVERGAPSAAGK